MVEKSLEQRMIRDIMICISKGDYQRKGEELRGSDCNYCTYLQPTTSIREPVDCGMRGNRVMILIDSNKPWFSHYISFYKCKR